MTTSDNNSYDLVVIGSGPAGQKAAICAAKMRKKVAVIERKRSIGGVCVNTGTIPRLCCTSADCGSGRSTGAGMR